MFVRLHIANKIRYLEGELGGSSAAAERQTFMAQLCRKSSRQYRFACTDDRNEGRTTNRDESDLP